MMDELLALASSESAGATKVALLLFAVIFLLNVMPAFAPPTWTVMSFIGLAIPSADLIWLPVIAAVAATCGRTLLAKLSRVLVRQRILSERTRGNVDTIRLGIEKRPALALSTFLAYAFSPLPSNYLFIAYGLTSLSIAFLALPFFVGRLLSYVFWIRTASAVGDWLDLDFDLFQSSNYFVAYFVLSQLLLVPMLYFFTRFDWRAMVVERQFRWLRRID